MTFQIELSPGADRDFATILKHLIKSYQRFGEPEPSAIARAEARILGLHAAMQGLSRVPFQGALRRHLGVGVRNVTKDDAIIYFIVDERAKT